MSTKDNENLFLGILTVKISKNVSQIKQFIQSNDMDQELIDGYTSQAQANLKLMELKLITKLAEEDTAKEQLGVFCEELLPFVEGFNMKQIEHIVGKRY